MQLLQAASYVADRNERPLQPPVAPHRVASCAGRLPARSLEQSPHWGEPAEDGADVAARGRRRRRRHPRAGLPRRRVALAALLLRAGVFADLSEQREPQRLLAVLGEQLRRPRGEGPPARRQKAAEIASGGADTQPADHHVVARRDAVEEAARAGRPAAVVLEEEERELSSASAAAVGDEDLQPARAHEADERAVPVGLPPEAEWRQRSDDAPDHVGQLLRFSEVLLRRVHDRQLAPHAARIGEGRAARRQQSAGQEGVELLHLCLGEDVDLAGDVRVLRRVELGDEPLPSLVPGHLANSDAPLPTVVV